MPKIKALSFKIKTLIISSLFFQCQTQTKKDLQSQKEVWSVSSESNSSSWKILSSRPETVEGYSSSWELQLEKKNFLGLEVPFLHALSFPKDGYLRYTICSPQQKCWEDISLSPWIPLVTASQFTEPYEIKVFSCSLGGKCVLVKTFEGENFPSSTIKSPLFSSWLGWTMVDKELRNQGGYLRLQLDESSILNSFSDDFLGLAWAEKYEEEKSFFLGNESPYDIPALTCFTRSDLSSLKSAERCVIEEGVSSGDFYWSHDGVLCQQKEEFCRWGIYCESVESVKNWLSKNRVCKNKKIVDISYALGSVALMVSGSLILASSMENFFKENSPVKNISSKEFLKEKAQIFSGSFLVISGFVLGAYSSGILKINDNFSWLEKQNQLRKEKLQLSLDIINWAKKIRTS